MLYSEYYMNHFLITIIGRLLNIIDIIKDNKSYLLHKRWS